MHKEKGADALQHLQEILTVAGVWVRSGEVVPAEDENTNVQVRKTVGVHTIEEHNIGKLPLSKQSETLKYLQA